MRRPLNLASDPFRNERLPAVLLGGAGAILLAVTVVHAVAVIRILPHRTSALHSRVRNMETEIEALKARAAGLRGPEPGKDQLAQWGFVRELADRRSFSWTAFLGLLEEALPRDVRLLSVTPKVRNGEVSVDTQLVNRSDDEYAFVRALKQRTEFDQVYPLDVNVGEDGLRSYRYVLHYRPVAPEAPVKAQQASREAAEMPQDPKAHAGEDRP